MKYYRPSHWQLLIKTGRSTQKHCGRSQIIRTQKYLFKYENFKEQRPPVHEIHSLLPTSYWTPPWVNGACLKINLWLILIELEKMILFFVLVLWTQFIRSWDKLTFTNSASTAIFASVLIKNGISKNLFISWTVRLSIKNNVWFDSSP